MKHESNHKLILSLIAVALIISLGSNFYFKANMDSNIESIKDSLNNFQTNTETRFLTLETLLENLQTKNAKDKQQLINLIEETEKSSKEKLSELEEELEGISVESGDLSAVIGDALEGVVSVITDISQGSGAIITQDGYIITNYHVIQGASRVAILDYKKKVYSASLINFTKNNDLAILKIDVNDHSYLNFGNSDKIEIGEKVAALGNPAGLGFTATEGIISQKDRVIQAGSVGLLQTDAQINPGNSGGPLINKEGNIIGILRLKVSGFEGLGFAIPSLFVKEYVETSLGKDL